MFDDIAYRYDFLNRFLSIGIDIHGEKKPSGNLKDIDPKKYWMWLPVQQMWQSWRHKYCNLKKSPALISAKACELGRKKIRKAGLGETIELLNGDSETIKFKNNTFDAVTVAFGVRNFQNLEKGLSEIKRVLRPGGKLVVLEFSKPKTAVVKAIV